MLQLRLFFFFLLFSTVLSGQNTREIRIVGTEGLVEICGRKNDTTYVINFWATWCKPCVEEMPYFEEIHNTGFSRPVKVILVSLDFENHLSSKVKPFVQKNNIQSEVVLMNNTRYNSWIDLIDPSWSGAIPATMVRKGDKVIFTEKSFQSFEELKEFINQ